MYISVGNGRFIGVFVCFFMWVWLCIHICINSYYFDICYVIMLMVKTKILAVLFVEIYSVNVVFVKLSLQRSEFSW